MNKINDNLYTFEGQQDIVSPQLVYYPAIIRENIRKMIDIAGGAARLWPHIKTHKMAEVVQMQIEAGIDRFKCATIAEAEMAAKAGAKHLTLAGGPQHQALCRAAGRLPGGGVLCHRR